METRKFSTLVNLVMITAAVFFSVELVRAQGNASSQAIRTPATVKVTPAMRQAAAERAANPAPVKNKSLRTMSFSMNGIIGAAIPVKPAPVPGGTPNYFGPEPNYANSPAPVFDIGLGALTGGMRKFVDSLPGLGAANANNLGVYIPIATADTKSFPGSDYYEIGVSDYQQQMHSDLPPTKLRGYKDLLAKGTDAQNHYLGPVILAKKDRPVRIKMVNLLGTGDAGKLFLPIDTTVMGAGMGPDGMNSYTENRATFHLHGGDTPWISDGTPHQWTVPAGENTPFKKGVSSQDVPDMPATGDGEMTFYYPNQQSGRFMFYHDHAFGITRVNVYAGEAAGYLITDPTEEGLIDSGVLPNQGTPAGVYRYGIPLVIQDKTFVDAAKIASQDPTWNWGRTPGAPGTGDLWFPHVYMPNQNPNDPAGVNAFGRWDYGPWFFPAQQGVNHGPVTLSSGLQVPGVPDLSYTPEGYHDTPVVNGVAYPYLVVKPTAYRFRVLNAANDRYFNLQLYKADPTIPQGTAGFGTEVKMVTAAPNAGLPPTWPTDGRDGGVPDPTLAGPSMIQIGTEGGLLPAPVDIPPQPVTWGSNGQVANHALYLGPAERADIIIDFSTLAPGTKVILYNDCPAPVPVLDPRWDYYTGNPDLTSTGGAPTTLPGYGPNTRTIMQFIVDPNGIPTPAYDVAKLRSAFASTGSVATNDFVPGAFAAAQPAPIVPESAYNSAYNANYTDVYPLNTDSVMKFTPADLTTPVSLAMHSKGILEPFEPDYGRGVAQEGVYSDLTQMVANLGNPDPVTEIFRDGETSIWRVVHNGMDTHPIHFHLFNVQLIARIGWDGTISPPEPNELGWKDTVKMRAGENSIVAFKSKKMDLPWPIPNSIRPLDVTSPLGTTWQTVDPNNNPISVVNQLVNFGWEYVWHCHILGHEENDMMRPMVFEVLPPGVSPVATANLDADPRKDAVFMFNASTQDKSGVFVLYNNTTWVKLHSLCPDMLTAADLDGNGVDELIFDYGKLGLWVFANNTTWIQLHNLDPVNLAAADLDGSGKADLVVDFGPKYGLWIYKDNGTWSQLLPVSAISMTVLNFDGNNKADLAINFGSPFGIWIYKNDQDWMQLHTMSAKSITAGNIDGVAADEVIVDFGAPYGVWVYYNGTNWIQLHPSSPRMMITADLDGNGVSDVVLDYGFKYGIWAYYNNSTWTQLHPLTSDGVLAAGNIDGVAGDDLIVGFGEAYGTWAYVDNSAWVNINTTSP